MRAAVARLEDEQLLPRERQELEQKLRAELTALWETEFLKSRRPTVLDEVARGLSLAPRLVETIPRVYATMRNALAAAYPESDFRLPVFLRFGTWIGGDRDGNPNVTAAITAQTLLRLRSAAIQIQLEQAHAAYDALSLTNRGRGPDSALQAMLGQALARWPALAKLLDEIDPREQIRHGITLIRWRLGQSNLQAWENALPDGAYSTSAQLCADVERLHAAATRVGGPALADAALGTWRDLAAVFGLHLQTLDIRQDSRRLLEVLHELFAADRICENYTDLLETEKQALLTRTMPWAGPLNEARLSPLARETLALFRLIRRALEKFGGETIGGFIISLTQAPSDLLGVLWLWRWAQQEQSPASDQDCPATREELRIVPLFEKIGDLQRGPETLAAILDQPAYRAHLQKQESRQQDLPQQELRQQELRQRELRQRVMVGYSDSTKDGGYLSACWGLYQAQSRLQAVAAERGVRLTFFHGRGGSLGRGGGPAARGIISLPMAALNGSLRLTEQGEVLAERYDDPQIAFRHLEQVTWATLVGAALPRGELPSAWLELVEELSARSLAVYRELVDSPGFIPFFSAATPIDEIEQLPIASRPARRRGERTLNDLRAIPWVFSWTQNRLLLPAWYGFGTAVSERMEREPAVEATLRRMYREWPFWQATLDNAALALAKADLEIAERYSELVEDAVTRGSIWEKIAAEFSRTLTCLMRLMEVPELLSGTPWLQQSIGMRNPYIDPINLIQIELLRRRRRLPETAVAEAEQLRDLLRLSVQGIASGMRTTG
jgi:phosphoenolpyruvate carboxylase